MFCGQPPRENEREVPVLNLHYSRWEPRMHVFQFSTERISQHLTCCTDYLYTWGQQYKKLIHVFCFLSHKYMAWPLGCSYIACTDHKLHKLFGSEVEHSTCTNFAVVVHGVAFSGPCGILRACIRPYGRIVFPCVFLVPVVRGDYMCCVALSRPEELAT
jgi:hypothetical protein